MRTRSRIPAGLAVLATMAEFLGSLGLAIGLLIRIAALGIAVVMLVAIVTFEYHLLALGSAVALGINGGGAWSVDAWIARSLTAWAGP